jgi:carboxyl-terminal processing protease
MQPDRRGIFLVATVLASSAVLGGLYGPNLRATTATAADNYQIAVRDFTKVLDVVQSNYAETVDLDKAIYDGAIPGMLRVLDPHSLFFDSHEFARLREDERGRYYGVGMLVGLMHNRMTISLPNEGGPAFNAGIRPGDVIVKVNDTKVDGMNDDEVAALLRGPRGTAVKVIVAREGYADPLTFTLNRDEIPKHSVSAAFILKPGIGYIDLSTFNEATDRDVADALKSLNATSLDGLVFDIRGNLGGPLNEAVAVCDKFLEKNQLIVSHHGRSSSDRRYYALRGNQGVTVPLVVLVNANSASAAEIIAGAVQDHDRGLIVGQTTFGKGLVQILSPLSEDTGIALTTARYYTPSGRLIQRDYKALSFYEYRYEHKVPEHTAEIRLTDSGRQVTGGGGITPDIAIQAPKFNAFQEDVLRKEVFFVNETGVGGFTLNFLGTRPSVTKDFEVSELLLNSFRVYLSDHKVPYTESDFSSNLDWIKHKIKSEVLLSSFGQTEGIKVMVEADPEVQTAVDALPRARALYQNARKIVAQRQSPASGPGHS